MTTGAFFLALLFALFQKKKHILFFDVFFNFRDHFLAWLKVDERAAVFAVVEREAQAVFAFGGKVLAEIVAEFIVLFVLFERLEVTKGEGGGQFNVAEGLFAASLFSVDDQGGAVNDVAVRGERKAQIQKEKCGQTNSAGGLPEGSVKQDVSEKEKEHGQDNEGDADGGKRAVLTWGRVLHKNLRGQMCIHCESERGSGM